jgi:hypothetical protein
MDDQTKSMKTVYTVIEKGPGKSFWVRIGTGFTNRDGSLNLHLDALPTNGKLQVRDWEPDRRVIEGQSQGADGSGARPQRPRPQPSPATDAVF